MPARDITGIKGRFLQAVLSRRFEGRDGYLLAIVIVAIAVLLLHPSSVICACY